jgi:hypothetical protein
VAYIVEEGGLGAIDFGESLDPFSFFLGGASILDYGGELSRD